MTDPSVSDQVEHFFGAYFEQKAAGETVKRYNITDCQSIYTPQQMIDAVGRTVTQLKCPDLDPQTEFIQLGGEFGTSNKFELIIGTCDSTKHITGRHNCPTEDESKNHVDKTMIEFMTLTMIPNGNVYVKEANNSWEAQKFSMQMSTINSASYTFTFNPVEGFFAYNWFWSIFQKAQDTFFQMQIVAPADQPMFESGKIMSYTIRLSNIVVQEQWYRCALMSQIGSLGGVTAVFIFFFGGIVQMYDNFSIDNDMIKALYTVPQRQDSKQSIAVRPSINAGYTESMVSQKSSSKYHLFNRSQYKYSALSGIIDYVKKNVCCCFCNKWICKQSRTKELFKKGQQKLYSEMDVVNLIKMQRISKFLISGYIAPQYMQIIQNFDQYCLKNDSDEEKSSSDGQLFSKPDSANYENIEGRKTVKGSQGWLSWYKDPHNTKKLLQKINEDAYTDSERAQLLEWYGQIQQLIVLKFQHESFSKDLLHGQHIVASSALKLIIGRKFDGQNTIDQVLTELNEQIQATEQKVLQFMGSTEGMRLIPKIQGEQYRPQDRHIW